jgi:hypothetical protein
MARDDKRRRLWSPLVMLGAAPVADPVPGDPADPDQARPRRHRGRHRR